MANCKLCGKKELAMFCICSECAEQIEAANHAPKTNLDWVKSLSASDLADFIKAFLHKKNFNPKLNGQKRPVLPGAFFIITKGQKNGTQYQPACSGPAS